MTWTSTSDERRVLQVLGDLLAQPQQLEAA